MMSLNNTCFDHINWCLRCSFFVSPHFEKDFAFGVSSCYVSSKIEPKKPNPWQVMIIFHTKSIESLFGKRFVWLCLLQHKITSNHSRYVSVDPLTVSSWTIGSQCVDYAHMWSPPTCTYWVDMSSVLMVKMAWPRERTRIMHVWKKCVSPSDEDMGQSMGAEKS
jgi:hypothetical protein